MHNSLSMPIPANCLLWSHCCATLAGSGCSQTPEIDGILNCVEPLYVRGPEGVCTMEVSVVQVPVSKHLLSVFFRWPADAGPPTWVSASGDYISRLYLKRRMGCVRPAGLLLRAAHTAPTACTAVQQAPVSGTQSTSCCRCSCGVAIELPILCTSLHTLFGILRSRTL